MGLLLRDHNAWFGLRRLSLKNHPLLPDTLNLQTHSKNGAARNKSKSEALSCTPPNLNQMLSPLSPVASDFGNVGKLGTPPPHQKAQDSLSTCLENLVKGHQNHGERTVTQLFMFCSSSPDDFRSCVAE